MVDINDLQVKVSMEGRTYEISFVEFTAMDARAFRDTLGMSLIDGFMGNVDVDVLAGLLWLHRRKSDKRLRYQTVAEKFTYADLIESHKLAREDEESSDDAPSDGAPSDDPDPS